MATVHEILQDLREAYVGDAAENLEQIGRLLRQLAAAPDRTALEYLHRRFLGLAGSGYTYGFPIISTLGRQGERLCAPILQTGERLTPSQLSACQGVLEGLREEFARLRAIYAVGPWIRPAAAAPAAGARVEGRARWFARSGRDS
jgi:hypothetical protein